MSKKLLDNFDIEKVQFTNDELEAPYEDPINVVFLDVDGVLNCAATYPQHNYIDPQFVENLAELVHRHDAKIVLSSSWRTFFTRNDAGNLIDRKLHQYGKTGLATVLIDALAKENLEIYDLVADIEFAHSKRGKEIKEWLNNHSVNHFVILDDDNFDFENEGLSPYHVRTHAGQYSWIPEEAQGFNKTKLMDAYIIMSPELFNY